MAGTCSMHVLSPQIKRIQWKPDIHIPYNKSRMAYRCIPAVSGTGSCNFLKMPIE